MFNSWKFMFKKIKVIQVKKQAKFLLKRNI